MPQPRKLKTEAHPIPDDPKPVGPSFTIHAEDLPGPRASEDSEEGQAERWRVMLIYPTTADPITYEIYPNENGVLDLKVNPIETGDVLVRVSDQDGALRFQGTHTVGTE